MPWKKNSPANKNTAPGNQDTFFVRLRREIVPIRAQGELPLRDPGSFARFNCELCTTAASLGELKQCALCGRWACSACWTPEYYVCNSCNGIIQIHLLDQNCSVRH
jgi:hypothetical protein